MMAAATATAAKTKNGAGPNAFTVTAASATESGKTPKLVSSSPRRRPRKAGGASSPQRSATDRTG